MRERKSLIFIAPIFFLIILASCVPQKEAIISPFPEKTASVGEKSSKDGWEQEWNRTLREAKKEGKVFVLGTVGTDTRVAIINGFKERYGIDVDYIAGRGGEISQKLITERRAGIFSTDVYAGGATTLINEIKPAGALDPLLPALILPEVIDEKNWWGGKLPLMDKDKMIFAFMAYPSVDLASNTELVKEGEVKSLKEIIEPKWKGKILMNDPTIAGAGLGWFGRNTDRFGVDFMKKLAENKPVILRDQRLQVEWLARGRYALLTNPQSEIIAEFIRAGAPVKDLELIEGVLSTGSGHVSLVNKAPHPNAARVLINWLLSREGQTVYSRSILQQSAREDVPIDHLERLRKPGVDYLKESDEERLLRRPAQAIQAREIFSDLLK